MTKGRSSRSIDAKVILVHTSDEGIVRALAAPEVSTIGAESFLSGELISPAPSHFDHGKRIHLNLRHVISITEFDSPSQFLGGDKKLSKLKLLKPK